MNTIKKAFTNVETTQIYGVYEGWEVELLRHGE